MCDVEQYSVYYSIRYITHVGGAAADVVVDLVSGRRRWVGAGLVRRDVDGVFTGEEHPAGGAGPQGGVGAQGGGVHLETHSHIHHTHTHTLYTLIYI